MIKKILTYYAERLDEYLSRLHHQPEGLAEVGFVGNSTEERPNKMVVSLINVERETAGGISAPVQRRLLLRRNWQVPHRAHGKNGKADA